VPKQAQRKAGRGGGILSAAARASRNCTRTHACTNARTHPHAQAIEASEAVLGKGHRGTRDALRSLGSMLEADGDHVGAEALIERAEGPAAVCAH
jgi:hypothetical protein